MPTPRELLHRSTESLWSLTSSDSFASLQSGLVTIDGLTKNNTRRSAAGGILTVLLGIFIMIFVIAQVFWFFTAVQQQITVPQLENDATISVPVCGGCGARTSDLASIHCSLNDDRGAGIPLRMVAAESTTWGIARPQNLWTDWSFWYGCVQIRNRDLLAEYLYTGTIYVNRSHAFQSTPVFVTLPLIEEVALDAATPTVRSMDVRKTANAAPFVRVSPALDRYFGWALGAYNLRFTTTLAPDISFTDQVILGRLPTAAQSTGPITTAWQYFPIGEREPLDCAAQAMAEYGDPATVGWNTSSFDCIHLQYILGGSRFVTTYQSTRSLSITIGIIGGFAGLVIGCARLCLQCGSYVLFRARDSEFASAPEDVPLS